MKNSDFKIEVVETYQPISGLTVTTYTDNTTTIEVSEDLRKEMIDFMASYSKETLNCGFVEAVAKKINCKFFSKHPITGRSTGHAKIGGRYLDKEQLKKLFGYETTKEPKEAADTKEAADKPKTPGKKHITRVTKLIRARADFMNRCKEIVYNASIDSCQNLNAFFLDCFKAAGKKDRADKKASDWVIYNSNKAKKQREETQKQEQQTSDFVKKSNDAQKIKIFTDMGYSLEQAEKMLDDLKVMQQAK